MHLIFVKGNVEEEAVVRHGCGGAIAVVNRIRGSARPSMEVGTTIRRPSGDEYDAALNSAVVASMLPVPRY